MWQSSGKESFVFRVNKPDDLRDFHIYAHADLMERTLRHDEELLHLLYSPIFPEKKAPFGLHATPASHAVAVTRNRFIISENKHMKGIAPTVQSIAFDQVLYVQLGSALSLGWFAIQFVENEKPFCTTLFFTVTGIEHFETLIRNHRRMAASNRGRFPLKKDWADIWRRAPVTQADRLGSLITEEELPFISIRSSERWYLEKKRWRSIPVCLSTNGILVSTNFGFIHAADESCIRPNIYSFGVNVSCISPDAMKNARIVHKWMHGNHSYVLRFDIGHGLVIVGYDVPFDENSLSDAEILFGFLAQDMTTEKQACTL
jgi:hypothetical protein